MREEWPNILFSSVYRTTPMELTDQADFLNAVCRFESNETPTEIFATLQNIEHTLKKSPPFRYGPRTIDLDLLLAGAIIRTEDPILPHPKLHERRFVLEPLIELAGEDVVHPTMQLSLKDLLKKVMGQECRKIDILPSSWNNSLRHS